MVKETMNPRNFFTKCEWEGGGLFEGFDYGLTPDDLDNSDPELKELVQRAYVNFRHFKDIDDLIDYESYLEDEDSNVDDDE